NLQLSAGSLGAVGTAVTIIDNEADNSSTFHGECDNAPNFATLAAGSELLTIDYFAGAHHDDTAVTRRPNLMVSNTQVNNGAAQRSRITSLTTSFNGQVTFAITPAAAFTLTRNSDGTALSF